MWDALKGPTESLLLFGEDRPEHRLRDLRFVFAAVGIDERIRTAAQLRVFGLQIVLGAVIAELHVAGQRFHIVLSMTRGIASSSRRRPV